VADEDNETEGKKKSPILKILLLVIGVIILLAGTVFGTLFATGFFDEKPAVSAEEALEGAEGAALEGRPAAAGGGSAGGGAGASGGPPANVQRVTRESPQLTRFEFRYHEVDREFLVNLTNSRRVMQVQIALMTRYDQRVFDNFMKHEFAIRSVTLDVMRQATEADTAAPDFRVKLAENIREAMNAKLEEFEDFGGIEEIYFTTFVIQ
jgi:flagellar protein FliL